MIFENEQIRMALKCIACRWWSVKTECQICDMDALIQSGSRQDLKLVDIRILY